MLVLFDFTFASAVQVTFQVEILATVRQFGACVSSRVFTLDMDLVTINNPAFVSLSEENVTVMSQIFDLKQNIHVKINLFLILVFIDHCHISFPINNV